MVVGGLDGHRTVPYRTVSENGRKERGPEASTINRFSLGVENEPVDEVRDSRPCLAIPRPQARTGTGEYSFSLFS